MKKIRLLFCIISLTLISCSKKTPVQPLPAPNPTISKDYIELGDLDSLKSRNKIRFVAPRFDGADALPREGVPVEDYQALAEAFAEAMGLISEWHFVEGFNELITYLKEGKADVVVTNMTITENRKKSVSFTRPITYIDEVIVSKNNPIVDFKEMENITIGVPLGTAYVQTLTKIREITLPSLNIETVASSASDSDILQSLLLDEFDATVLDSDLAKNLLLDYPNLKSGLTLKKNRPIAWATRMSNPNLLNELNAFFTSHFLRTSRNTDEKRSWEQIKSHGKLRMLTLNNPASYFMWRGELMGFDLELVKEFAKENKLHVSVILKDSIGDLISALQSGEGDLIAASITQTKARENLGLVFSDPYLKIKEVLVGTNTSPPVLELSELSNRSVGVNPGSVYHTFFTKLQKEGVDVDLKSFPKITNEELTEKLINGEIEYTALDSHFLAIEQAHNDNLRVIKELGENVKIAWATRNDQSELLSKINEFIKKEYRGLFYNLTYKKYFEHSRKIIKINQERITETSRLSPYDEIVKPLAESYGMDWRLVISQMYQESKFNPKAKSFAGAKGLMQVMPRTAKEFGFKDLNQPQVGIEAGITYMNWIEQRFPGDIEFQERIFFMLAAYNAGVGHVRDARRLASQLGKDPNKWFDNVENAMLLLSKPSYYKKARFGYVRGSEPVNYVKSIYERYLGYLQFKDQQ